MSEVKVVRETTVQDAIPHVRQLLEDQLARLSDRANPPPVDDVAREVAEAAMGYLLTSPNITVGRTGVAEPILAVVQNAKYLTDALPGLSGEDAIQAYFKALEAAESAAERHSHQRWEEGQAAINKAQARKATAEAKLAEAQAKAAAPVA